MNKTNKILLGIIILIILVDIIFFFLKFTENTVSKKDTIKIGAIFPLSGNNVFYGESLRQGLELSKEEINSKGGINGRKIQIIYEDSESDIKKAISSYNKLVNADNTKVIFSFVGSVTLGLAPIAEKDKKILFSISGSAPKISQAGDYIFRHNVLPETESKYLADIIYNKFKIKEIAVIYANIESGVSYKEEFVKDYEKIGGKVVLLESYESNEKDFRTKLIKIKNSNAKGIFSLSYITETGTMLKQAKELGINKQWFFNYGIEGDELIKIAGDSSEGIIYSDFFDKDSNDPITKNYLKNYKEKYQKDSEVFAALVYDGMYLISIAMENCKDPKDTVCIKNELYKIKNYHGVTGNISFDSNGDTGKTLILKTVKNGKFVKYEE